MLHRSGAAKPATVGHTLLRVLFGAALVILLQVLCTGNLHAQIYTGTITGTVTDSTGAAVPGATVTAVNTATGEVHPATTSAQGVYFVPQLAAGTYSVTISQDKFKESVINNVVVRVSSDTRADAKLQVGSVSQKVTVTADPLEVQTTSASVGTVISGTQVKELPLNGENFMNLVTLVPGVSTANSFDTIDKGLQGGADFAVNGNPYNTNLFLVDGVNNNDVGSGRTILIYPSTSTIAEFKMLTNSYGPEYGQASGAIISITTKSGTNQIHGGFFYAGRNNAVAANDWISNNNKTGQAELRRNDFGYNISGPIMKNKLFLWWNQEWDKEVTGVSVSDCMPTAAEAGGDFSKDFGAAPVPGTTTDQCGATAPTIPVADQGANPETIANPSVGGEALEKYYPLPNQSKLLPNGANWAVSEREKPDWSEWHVRGDYDITPKNHATFAWTDDANTNPGPNPGIFWGDNPYGPISTDWSQPARSVMARLTSNITNSLVNDVEFGYGHNAILTSDSPQSVPLVNAIEAAIPDSWPTSLGKIAGTVNQVGWGSFGNYGSIQGATLWNIAGYDNHEDLYAFQDNLTKVQGNHLVKIGAYFSTNAKVENSAGTSDRSFFNPANYAVATPTTNGLANLLLPGQVFNGSNENTTNPAAQLHWHDFEWYIGDTWKARHNLTLSYGFRWSALREPYAGDNHYVNWSVATWSAAEAAAHPTDACNGVITVPGTSPCFAEAAILAANGVPLPLSSGVAGPNRALAGESDFDIAPRLGVNWDVFGDGKTSVRAGFGEFYEREAVAHFEGLAFSAPFVVNAASNRTLAVAAPLASASVSPNFARDPRAVVPSSFQWNLAVEQALGRNMTLQVGYVGNAAEHQTSWQDPNAVNSSKFLEGAFASQTADINNLRYATNFGSMNYAMRTGHASYNALQATFRAQTGKFSTFNIAYTYSHSIGDVALDNSSGSGSNEDVTDQQDRSLDRGNTDINRPQILVANEVFYLPKLEGSNAIVRGVAGGWEFNSIISAFSGSSMSVFSNGASDVNAASSVGSVAGVGGDCPFATANGGKCNLQSLLGSGFASNNRPLANPGYSCNTHVAGAQRNQIFNPNAFTLVGYQLGTTSNMIGRGVCHGPTLYNVNATLAKNWSFKERYNIKLSLDAFNLFNHPNFTSGSLEGANFNASNLSCGAAACTPLNNVVTAQAPKQNSGFGQTTSLIPGEQSRQLQYSLRFDF